MVQSLNETSDRTGDWDDLSRHGGYDPSFIHLMNENSRLAAGVDLMDHDPLCQCQDVGIHYSLSSFSQLGPNKASMRITSAQGPVTAILRRTAGAWRVYDVVDAAGSFRARLIHDNICMRAYHRPAQWERCFADIAQSRPRP